MLRLFVVRLLPFTLSLLILPAAMSRSAPGAIDLAARIKRTDNGLLLPNVVKGQQPSHMKLVDRMKYYGTPGVSIAVINNYALEWAQGYGTLEAGSDDAVTPATLFQAGSISKPVTAVAALRLMQQGDLNIDEDVNQKLISWKVPENEFTQSNKVTVREILTHTAGFDVLFYEGTPVGEPVPTALQVLNGESPATNPPIRVAYPPGRKNVYSGGGFLVLQQLLVDVTGESFPQLMEDLVLRPLGMTSSSFQQPLPRALSTRAASGNQRGEPVKGKWLIKPNMASGGLWSTASDISRFVVELQRARLGRSATVITRKTATLMLPPRESRMSGGDGNEVRVRGLGLSVDGEGQTFHFSHGGYTTGYRSEMIGLGNGKGVVILTNGNSQALLREIIRSVATEYKWNVPKYLPIERTVVVVGPNVLKLLVGEYEFPEGRTPRVSVVSVKDGALYLDGAPLQAESRTRFFGESEATYTFISDANAQVREMVYDAGGLKLIAKKIK